MGPGFHQFLGWSKFGGAVLGSHVDTSLQGVLLAQLRIEESPRRRVFLFVRFAWGEYFIVSGKVRESPEAICCCANGWDWRFQRRDLTHECAVEFNKLGSPSVC